jgi:hypothetical protein
MSLPPTKSSNPSVLTESKEWRANSKNIYFRRNIWAVIDYGIYFFASLFLGSLIIIPTMFLFSLTPAKNWAIDVGTETFVFLYAIIIFIFLEVRGSLVRGGTILFNKFAKLKITTREGTQPKMSILILRSILKILIVPALLSFIPAILWAISYIFIVKDKTEISPIDMLLKTKASKV